MSKSMTNICPRVLMKKTFVSWGNRKNSHVKVHTEASRNCDRYTRAYQHTFNVDAAWNCKVFLRGHENFFCRGGARKNIDFLRFSVLRKKWTHTWGLQRRNSITPLEISSKIWCLKFFRNLTRVIFGMILESPCTMFNSALNVVRFWEYSWFVGNGS